MGWGHSCRLRHVTSGRYLAATADNQVVTFHRGAATEEATAFVVRESKVRIVKTVDQTSPKHLHEIVATEDEALVS